MAAQRIIHLTPPRLSPEHIAEKITCIRAHRERIFNTQAVVQDNKLICHNYGQGGAGWTFLFGCVNESIRQFEQKLQEHPRFKNQPITIIGAGCYGLLTTITLKRLGYTVRIIAKETDDLPSHKAAGFFFPRARKCSTPEEIAIFTARGIESYRAYQQIIAGLHPFIKAGPKLLPAYYGLDIAPGFAPYSAQNLVAAPESVTIDFGNSNKYQAHEYQVIFIDATLMMRELHQAMRELHVPIKQQTITNFSEISESIIFNCSGLGAKELAPDKRIVPVQGHLIMLKDQPIEQLHYMINMKVAQQSPRGYLRDELIYFAPKGSGILGITFMRGEDSPSANEHEFDRLLERCKTYFGS